MYLPNKTNLDNTGKSNENINEFENKTLHGTTHYGLMQRREKNLDLF